MIKFTNLRTKALALVAMTAFSVGSVFGSPIAPPANPFFGGTVTTGPKILQWSNQTKLQAPVSEGAIAQGVKVTFSDSPTGMAFNTIAVAQSATVPTTNPGVSTYWVNGSALNLFAGENNKVAVSFDISTKYLTDVKDLQIALDANTFGGTSNMNVNFHMALQVYDLSGNLVDYSDIYQGAGITPMPWPWFGWNEEELSQVYPSIYNTSEGSKLLKLFQTADDVVEDHDFIPGSLDNKIIRVTLISDRPTGAVVNNFPAAMVVKSVSIDSNEPTLTLSRTAEFNPFEAGMGYTTPESALSLLTVDQDGLNLPSPAASAVEITSPNGFKVCGLPSTAAVASIMIANSPVSDNYVFAPEIIKTFSGTFTAAAKFINANDPLSPIQALTAESQVVNGSSVPELNLSEDKLIFTEGTNWTSKDIQIWGKNIPAGDQGDFRFVGGHADDQDDSALAEVGVDNEFTIGDLGVIAHNSSNVIEVDFAQFLNNVDINVAKFVKMSRRYRIHDAFGVGDDFTGKEARLFTNPDAELIPFPQVLVVGNVGAVWFEYEGTEGTPGQVVGDISTAFYAPYNAELLTQATSRTKTFYLKGAKVKANSSDEAIFEISLDKIASHDDDGHIAFLYSVDKGATWKTAATKSTIKVKLLTAKQILDFQEIGVPIMVKFRPDCDGFEEANDLQLSYHNHNVLYKWTPHFNCLLAEQTNEEGAAGAAAVVFGDTRANLENTIHDWKFVDVMENSVQVFWSGSFLTKSEFRKDYGNTFLGSCGEQTNPLSEGEFFVTGYNLTDKVSVVANKDAYNEDAFVITVEPVAGFGVANGLVITPNEFGEVYAKVTVKFAPTVKAEGRRAVNDLITVAYEGNTVANEGSHWWDPEFNFVDILNEYMTEHGPIHDLFLYPAYDYPEAVLCGRVYDPTFEAVDVAGMTAPINGETTQDFTFSASDLDKTLKTVTLALVNNSASPYTITSPKVLNIDENGNVNATVTVKFAPTPANKCNNLNSIVYTYGTCASIPVEESEIAGTTIVAQPTFQAFQAGDIQGDRVDLRITPAVGGENYLVGIGVLKYNKVTSSIFMSEVYAANDKIFVELFNGTGEELNGDIITEDAPNYYLQIFKSGVTAAIDTIILDGTDEALWAPYGIEVKSIDFDMDGSHDYKLVLKQGQITLDVYEFTGDISHKTRKDDLAVASYKTSTFTESDWTTVGGWHTSLNALTQVPLYASMFHAEVEAANFKQYFEDVTAEKLVYGFGKGASVSNLKKGVTYTAYAQTVPACDAVVVDGHPAIKLVPASDSNRVTGDAMDGVTFGFFTGIDQVEVAKNIYAANGKIYVAGATEGVTIFNALGMQVKAASIEEAAAGIDVANGIYMVKSGDKTAKVLVNK
nr:hypothetical protein [uncultured Macellibacteroides sp.]